MTLPTNRNEREEQICLFSLIVLILVLLFGGDGRIRRRGSPVLVIFPRNLRLRGDVMAELTLRRNRFRKSWRRNRPRQRHAGRSEKTVPTPTGAKNLSYHISRRFDRRWHPSSRSKCWRFPSLAACRTRRRGSSRRMAHGQKSERSRQPRCSETVYSHGSLWANKTAALSRGMSLRVLRGEPELAGNRGCCRRQNGNVRQRPGVAGGRRNSATVTNMQQGAT